MTAELQQKDDVRNHIRPAQDRSVPWFDEKLSSVPDDARALLEKYSGIPHDEVESHVVKIVRFHTPLPSLAESTLEPFT